MTAVLSLALSTSKPITVKSTPGYVHISFDSTQVTIPADEVPALAADLLDAIAVKSIESVEVQA
jgi:hypothetical protein